MANLRQSILVRSDLNLPVGLLAAQVAHVHMELFRQKMLNSNKELDLLPDLKDWLKDPYTFIHKVPNLEVLQYFATEAEATGIEVTRWRDTIYIDISPTQRRAFPSVLVGVALGPTDSDRIKSVIGDLPLL